MDKVRLCDAKTPQPCWNGSPYQPIPITDEATTQQALQIRERRRGLPRHHRRAHRRTPLRRPRQGQRRPGARLPLARSPTTRSARPRTPTRRYLRSDQVGRSGLEREYDEQLRGKAGVTRYEVDNLGRVIGKAEATPPQPGANLVTSIDARVQARRRVRAERRR